MSSVQDECASAPCVFGAACAESSTNAAVAQDVYNCTCAAGWEVPQLDCRVAASECASAPCLNGGTCFEKLVDDYTCDCVDGWAGPTCGAAVQLCWYWEQDCDPHAQCTHTGPSHAPTSPYKPNLRHARHS